MQLRHSTSSWNPARVAHIDLAIKDLPALRGRAQVRPAVVSGIGYAIWYTALPALKATSAATVQLSVPIIAAIGGIVFLDESASVRLVLASVAILGGIALVIREKQNTSDAQPVAPADAKKQRG